MRMRTSCGAAAIVITLVACSSSSEPVVTAPAEDSPTPASVTIVDDDLLNGNAFTLTFFDGVSVLGGVNDQGSFTAPYDTSTVFRLAKLDKYPSDPCRDAAALYNAAGGTVDTSLNTALAALVSGGCHARVLVATGNNVIPPDPIKSFRPIP